jgi:GNAT superfamily N-acetyltransferase
VVDVAMVVASNREAEFRAFFDAWHGEKGFPWDVTILVQDGGGEPFQPDDEDDDDYGQRYRWQNLVRHDWGSIVVDSGMVMPDWLSRRDSGIKAWGFLDAVLRHKADVVITLDDDCFPCPLAADPSWRRKGVEHAQLIEAARADFVGQHVDALHYTRRWSTSVPGFTSRGMPYGTLADGQRQPRAGDNSLGALPVALNMGVWGVIPDRDAVHELTNWTEEGYYKPWKPQKNVYQHSRVMSPQQYWPLCGMNLAFRREIAPLLYLPRMGEGVPFRRFDDIWCGVIAQKCLRHLGMACTVGGPIINHMRASQPMDNLVREAPGIRANEEFWRLIDRIELWPVDQTPLRCMSHIGNALAEDCTGIKDEQLRAYMPQLGGWIQQWCNLFRKAGWEP